MIYIKIFNLIYLFPIIRLIFGYNCWYKAGSGTASYKGDSKNVVAAANSYSVGNMGIEVVLGTPSGNPVLTNAQGETWYYVGEHLVQDTSERTTTGTFTLDLHFYEYTVVGGTGTKAADGKQYYALDGGVWTLQTVTVGTTDVSAMSTREEITSTPARLAAYAGAYKVVLTPASDSFVKLGENASDAIKGTKEAALKLNFSVEADGTIYKYSVAETPVKGSAWAQQTIYFGFAGEGAENESSTHNQSSLAGANQLVSAVVSATHASE